MYESGVWHVKDISRSAADILSEHPVGCPLHFDSINGGHQFKNLNSLLCATGWSRGVLDPSGVKSDYGLIMQFVRLSISLIR